MLYEQRFNPLSQFGMLLGLCGVGIIISGIVAVSISKMVLNVSIINLADVLMKPENIQLSRLLQVVTTFISMGIPAFVIARISNINPLSQLGLRTRGNIYQLILVALMVGTGFYISASLAELNQLIPISKSAANYFRTLEDNYNKQVMAIGLMQSATDYILSLFVLALVPAIFEEMLFRGCLQRIMIPLTRNTFAGILITGIIFSVIHISYYGFLPRLFLGLMLGYIFYYSKNLWLCIAAHFFNNAYTLTMMYILSRSGKLNMEALNETFPWYLGVIGSIILYFLFVAFRRESKKMLDYNESTIKQQHNEQMV